MEEQTFTHVIETVRRLVVEQVIPQEQEIEDRDEIPARLREAAADLGLFGYALPPEHGGLGMTMSQDVRLTFEVSYACSAFRSLFSTNNGIAGQMIARFGNDDQRATYLPGLASGEQIASFALTEDGAGSDPTALRTTARRRGTAWELNGRKRFITNAPLAAVFVVFARAESEGEPLPGISAFIVPATAPGVSVGPRDHKMGQRGAWTAEVFLDDVVLSDAYLLGEIGRAYSSALSVLSRGRLHLAAACIGAGQRALDEAVAHARVSTQGHRRIGDFQFVQGMLAESYAELAAGRSMVLSTAAAYDAGEDMIVGPSAAKLYCSEMVARVADRAVQIHGGMGYMSGTVAERLYRDVRLFRIYEGTSEIQKVIVGRALTREAVAG